jgi:protein-disulfide isomerase
LKYLIQNDQADASLKRAGIDIEALRKDQSSHAKDIDALLTRNDAEAHALNLRGTPGIVIGRQLLPGIVDLNGLKQLVALAYACHLSGFFWGGSSRTLKSISSS